MTQEERHRQFVYCMVPSFLSCALHAVLDLLLDSAIRLSLEHVQNTGLFTERAWTAEHCFEPLNAYCFDLVFE